MAFPRALAPWPRWQRRTPPSQADVVPCQKFPTLHATKTRHYGEFPAGWSLTCVFSMTGEFSSDRGRGKLAP
uniref:Uncharacterized protein n=1 Tax=Triticum urartu TaxID=4572 RepID=A0A8R7PQQ6_TRIUA